MTDFFDRFVALHFGQEPILQPILPAPFAETAGLSEPEASRAAPLDTNAASMRLLANGWTRRVAGGAPASISTVYRDDAKRPAGAAPSGLARSKRLTQAGSAYEADRPDPSPDGSEALGRTDDRMPSLGIEARHGDAPSPPAAHGSEMDRRDAGAPVATPPVQPFDTRANHERNTHRSHESDARASSAPPSVVRAARSCGSLPNENQPIRSDQRQTDRPRGEEASCADVPITSSSAHPKQPEGTAHDRTPRATQTEGQPLRHLSQSAAIFDSTTVAHAARRPMLDVVPSGESRIEILIERIDVQAERMVSAPKPSTERPAAQPALDAYRQRQASRGQ